MIFGETPAAISENTSFNAVLDETCERLMDRQAQYSIQRIQQMEESLAAIERELDEFISKR